MVPRVKMNFCFPLHSFSVTFFFAFWLFSMCFACTYLERVFTSLVTEWGTFSSVYQNMQVFGSVFHHFVSEKSLFEFERLCEISKVASLHFTESLSSCVHDVSKADYNTLYLRNSFILSVSPAWIALRTQKEMHLPKLREKRSNYSISMSTFCGCVIMPKAETNGIFFSSTGFAMSQQ